MDDVKTVLLKERKEIAKGLVDYVRLASRLRGVGSGMTGALLSGNTPSTTGIALGMSGGLAGSMIAPGVTSKLPMKLKIPAALAIPMAMGYIPNKVIAATYGLNKTL